jgi:hypothetical protein
VLGLIAALLGWRHLQADPLVRFLGWTGGVVMLVLTLIPYKTPWLLCLPVALVLPLAASGFLRWVENPRGKIIALAAVLGVSAWQGFDAWRLAQRDFWDLRLPLVYSPTSRDLPKLQAYLESQSLRGPVAVVGLDYWPLPWYLRRIPSVGYFDTLPSGHFEALILCGTPPGAGDPAPGETESLWGLRENVFLRCRVPR